jgi:hypothetical protein
VLHDEAHRARKRRRSRAAPWSAGAFGRRSFGLGSALISR